MVDFKISELKLSDIKEATKLVVNQMDSAEMWKGSSFDEKSIALVLCHCVLTEGNCAFVARLNGKIIGIISGYLAKPFYSHNREIREYGICVEHKYRDSKVGRSLISKWIHWGLAKDPTADIYFAWMSGEDEEKFKKTMEYACFDNCGTMYKFNKMKASQSKLMGGE